MFYTINHSQMPKTTKTRCFHLIYVSKNSKKWRRCRKPVYDDGKCYQHYRPMMANVGICCVCHGDCNPCSQACGRCARDMTMQALGWK